MVRRNSMEVRADTRRVRHSLKAMADPRLSGIKEGNRRSTEIAVKAVKSESPVRSGATKRSVRAVGSDKDVLAVGDSTAKYVPVILAGRKTHAPYPGDPFIARGIGKTARGRIKAYNKSINRAIRKLGLGR